MNPAPSPALARALRIYRFGLPIAAALLVPGFLLRMLRRGNFKENFAHRFGWFEMEEKARLRRHRWTWIRSISVGETLVALKLARALHQAEPETHIALSVTTSTGFALAKEAASDWLFPMYNPVDSQSAVEGVLDVLNPERLVLVEGEIWPNLVTECVRRRIPVLVANARLSARSAKRFSAFHSLIAPVFELLEWVGIPEPEDQARWEAVGVRPTRIHLTGSIKFDHTDNTASRAAQLQELLRASNVPASAPILVAGSTHEGEEELLALCFAKWKQQIPGLRLLLAPRHVERVPALLRELEPHRFQTVRRSALPDAAPWDILLLDTTGELRDWYSLGSVAFVGKSLSAHGGQNPAEPALAGKPVVFGPHMENFENVVRLLLAAQGAVQVRDVDELQQVVLELLRDPKRCAILGDNAGNALKIHQGSTQKTVEALRRFKAPSTLS